MSKSIIRRSWTKATGMLLVALMVLAGITLVMMLSGSHIYAADYGYKIHVAAGNEGAFADGSSEFTMEVQPGGTATLDLEELGVQVTDDQYFAKGLRTAGHDDGDNTIVQSVTMSDIQEDQSFVVAYGIRSSMVQYCVRYVDQDGNELLPESKHYGSVGDKPVVSFRYINYYAPTAYNEKKTLSEDEDSNVFTFVYYKSELPVKVIRRQTNNGNGNAAGNTAAPANGNGNTPAAAGRTGNATADADGNGNTQNAADQAAAVNEATPGTPNMVDLDDQDVPLAAPEGTHAGAESSHGIIWILLIVVGAAVIVVAVVFHRRRRAHAAA